MSSQDIPSSPVFSQSARDRRPPMLSSQSSQGSQRTGGHNDFVKGSICHMVLKDFMVHKEFKFYPSARLNIVIGPSGSGKSAILAGLCCCLGGKVGLLGRVKTWGELVRRGCTKAELEVHLVHKVSVGEGGEMIVDPMIIRCVLDKAGHRQYWVDGKSKSETSLIVKLDEMNVRLDNMCQFLPQERIGEFSRMDSKQLLEESIKAIGSGNMYNEHMEIIELDEKVAGLDAGHETLQRRVNTLELNVEALMPGVERHRAREIALEDIKVMKAKRPHLELRDKQRIYDEAMVVYEDRKAAHKASLAEMQPLRDARDAARDVNAAMQENVTNADAAIKKTQQTKRAADEEWRRLLEARVEKETELTQYIASKRQREENLRAKSAELRAAEAELQREASSIVDEEQLKERLKSIATQLTELSTWREDLEQQRLEVEREMKDINGEVERLKRTLNADDHFAKMLQRMQSSSLAHAVKFEREVRAAAAGTFRDAVFGPIGAYIKPKTALAAKVLDNMVPDYVKGGFVVTNPDDARTIRNMKVQRGREWIGSRCTLEVTSLSRPPMSPEESTFASRRSGPASGWLLDMFDAPPQVKAALCQESSVNCVFVVEGDVSEAVLREAPPRVRICSATHSFSKRVGKYSGESISQVQPLESARLFGHVEDTSDRQRDAEARIAAFNKNMEACKRKETGIRGELDSRKHTFTKLNEEKMSILSSVSRVKELRKKVAKLASQVASLREDNEDQSSDIRDGIWAILKRQAQRLKKRGDVSVVCASAIREGLLCKVEQTVASNLAQAADDRLNQAKASQRSIEAEYNAASARAKEASSEAKRAKKLVESTPCPPEMKARFSEFDDDIVLLDRAITDAEAKTRLMDVDQDVLKSYEEKKAELDRVRADLEANIHTRGQSVAQLEAKQGKWHKELYEQVQGMDLQFQKFLSHFKCSGKLELDVEGKRPKDYGLVIKISFRENGELRALSGTRHSGGERAVTTMLYMLAMQELTPCPFRVVDEINQGMDSVNERLLFQQIMDTCGKAVTAPTTASGHVTGRQYFVVSPKLLPELAYARCVRVHIVNSGMFAIVNSGSVHPADLLAKKRSRDDAVPSSQHVGKEPVSNGHALPIAKVPGSSPDAPQLPARRPVRPSQVVIAADEDSTDDEL